MTIAIVLAIVAAYLIGSIPTAYLVGRVNGVDLRTVGSGNLGATNVFRTLGWKWGLLVYVVDVLKGVAPVLWLPETAPAASRSAGMAWIVMPWAEISSVESRASSFASAATRISGCP